MSKDGTLIQFGTYAAQLSETLSRLDEEEIRNLVRIVRQAKQRQSTVFIAGNGGNASTASHWAADLGKGVYHRRQGNGGLKAISLSDNLAWITATANDIDYACIFSDQLRAHGKEGDLLIALSVSGNSPSIVHALEYAIRVGIVTVSVVGCGGGKAWEISDHAVRIPGPPNRYGPPEDIQLILNHFLCDCLVEEVE